LLAGKIESIGVMGCAGGELDACYGRQAEQVLIEMSGAGVGITAPCE
jgi:hypothetical protein